MSRRHAAAASLTLFDGVAVVEPERLVAGVDEAGRGPLAGPVAVAAVVFDPSRPRINGLDDSKQLTAARREQLHDRIIERALAWHVVLVDVDTIDRLNIYQATCRACARWWQRSPRGRLRPHRRQRGAQGPGAAGPGADRWRRHRPRDHGGVDPGQGFARPLHAGRPRPPPAVRLRAAQGYGTPAHLAALREHGPCMEHRRSFAPVRECLDTTRAPRSPERPPTATGLR